LTKLNPEGESDYRVELSRRHLQEAEDSFERDQYRRTVESSQLSAENAAKAVIALYRVPTWAHDPSKDLEEVSKNMDESFREIAMQLSKVARELAPEHGRVTYGDPVRRVTPWELYGKEEAREALRNARKAVGVMNQLMEGLQKQD
jgi:HEPN domain-containing protein